MTREVFAQRLRAARVLAGHTQESLRAELGEQLGNVRNWDTGRALPDPEKIARIARLLGVSSDYLLGLSDVPQSAEGSPTPFSEALIAAMNSSRCSIDALAEQAGLPCARVVAFVEARARPSMDEVRAIMETGKLAPRATAVMEAWMLTERAAAEADEIVSEADRRAARRTRPRRNPRPDPPPEDA